MDFEEDTYNIIFTSLKHPLRRKILRLLNDYPMTYTEILNQFELETGVLNYHLDSLRELLNKSEGNRYRLSDLGKAANSLVANVEEPVKKKLEGARLFGGRVKLSQLLAFALVLLLSSNLAWGYSYSQVENSRSQSMSWVLSDVRGLLRNSIALLNASVSQEFLELGTLRALSVNLLRLSIQFDTLGKFDPGHLEDWVIIRESVESLQYFFDAMAEPMDAALIRDGTPAYRNLTWPYNQKIDAIMRDLSGIESGLWRSTSRPGSDAVATADRLLRDVANAKIAFHVPEKISAP